MILVLIVGVAVLFTGAEKHSKPMIVVGGLITLVGLYAVF